MTLALHEALDRLRDCTHHRPACAATGMNAGQMLALVEDRPIPPASPCNCGLDAALALLAAAADAGARARGQAIEECADLIEQTLLDQDIVVLGKQTGDVATIARGIGREMAAALRAILAPEGRRDGE